MWKTVQPSPLLSPISTSFLPAIKATTTHICYAVIEEGAYMFNPITLASLSTSVAASRLDFNQSFFFHDGLIALGQPKARHQHAGSTHPRTVRPVRRTKVNLTYTTHFSERRSYFAA